MRSPIFSVSVVLTVALAAGAATAVFSVLDAVLLRPLPYAEAERLVEVRMAGGRQLAVDAARYRAWMEAGQPVFDRWIGFLSSTRVRTDVQPAERLSALAVTPGAESMLGIPLLHGRGFTEDDARGGEDVVLLSRGYFERLGGDPDIVGSTLRLTSGPVTVVGVLQGGARFPDYGGDRDLWLLVRDDFTVLGSDVRFLQGVWAGLREGVSIDAAREAVARITDALERADPRPEGWGLDLVPVGVRRANPDIERSLWLLSATVAAILIIAVMNGLNLLGIRTLARSRELLIRRALGGSRMRIRGQLLVEGLLLGLCAGAAAAVLAWLALAGMIRLVPQDLTFFSVHPLGIERRALIFAFGASLATGAVLGLLPGLGARTDRLAPAPATDDSRAGRRVRSLLTVGQVALSTTLLASGALFVGSFLHLVRVDPGFDWRRLAQADLQLSTERYATDADRAQLFARLDAALEAHPSVDGATASEGTAFAFDTELEAEGEPLRPDQPGMIPYTRVDVDYVEVTGIDLIAGRSLQPSDLGRDVAIVDADLARFLWGTESVVGRRFRLDDREWTEVIGVARELRLMGRDQRAGPYQILYPRDPERIWSFASVFVRTSNDPRSVLPLVREAVRSVDPFLSVWRLRTAGEALAEPEQTARFLAVLMSLLAGIGIATATVGVFGVLGYSVQRRERELGVRKALGAEQRSVLLMVLREGLTLGSAGILLGLAGSLLASGLAESLLYELSPRDPRFLAAPVLPFLALIAVASFLPARRATLVDPVEALRAD